MPGVPPASAARYALIGVGLLAWTTASAQDPPWPGSGGWGPTGPYWRLYDSRAERTFSGRVIKITTEPPMPGMTPGVQLHLLADGRTIEVHLGPRWYVAHQDGQIDIGDEVRVIGSLAAITGAPPALLAREVHAEDSLLVLRDRTGVPAWAGWRRRASRAP